MIALGSFEQGAGFGAHLYGCFADSLRVSRITEYATYCGKQDDGMGGSFELWTLTRDIPGHPKGSTVARATIEQFLFPTSKP